MAELNQTIATDLAARYQKLAGWLRETAAPLSEEQFWAKPFPFGNSFGHLVLHLTGNLNYYIGAQIAGTGYVRDRPREFAESTPPTKKEALKKLGEAMEMVVQTIRAQSEGDWSKEYSATGVDAKNRFDIVLQCATHLHHHIGQMMYLGFELKRKGLLASSQQAMGLAPTMEGAQGREAMNSRRIFLYPSAGIGGKEYLRQHGTLEDLRRLEIKLVEGQTLHFYNEDADDNGVRNDLLFEGIAHFDSVEHEWYAEIDEQSYRHASVERR
jgi:uncharacterized damage-inducible protein DinB